MSDELKRCPFCGGKLEISHGETMGGYFARCKVCHLFVPLGLNYDLAVELLNTRPIEDELTAEISRLTSELTNGRELLAMALAEGERLTAEVESLTTYCDKLAAGYPDGMLPTDIQVIRDANWTLAQQVHDRDAEIESLRLQLEIEKDYE